MPKDSQSRPVKLPPFSVEKVCRSLTIDEIIDAQLVCLQIPESWRISQGEGVKIAVLDSCFKTANPDLEGACELSLAKDFSGVGELDNCKHGIWVAGMIGARENSQGIIGICPKASIINIRCLDDRGECSHQNVYDALKYCLAIKPDIVNMSLGMSDFDPVIEKALKQLYDLNIVVVVAAGNNGRENSVDYPGTSNYVITVGATDKDNRVAWFSSRGDAVDILAPGVGIYSTYGENSYARCSGTSMATPVISGICGLLKSVHRQREAKTGKNDCITVPQFLEHLIRHSIPLGGSLIGSAGLVNPLASLQDGEPPAVNVEAKGFPWNPSAWVLENSYSVFAGKAGINWDSPDGWLKIVDGVWTIAKNYAWDGSSGVPDFVRDLDPITGKAKDYYASLVHDVCYRYLRQHLKDFPYKKWQIDFFYFRLLRQYGFRHPYLYFFGVLLLGWTAL